MKRFYGHFVNNTDSARQVALFNEKAYKEIQPFPLKDHLFMINDNGLRPYDMFSKMWAKGIEGKSAVVKAITNGNPEISDARICSESGGAYVEVPLMVGLAGKEEKQPITAFKTNENTWLVFTIPAKTCAEVTIEFIDTEDQSNNDDDMKGFEGREDKD